MNEVYIIEDVIKRLKKAQKQGKETITEEAIIRLKNAQKQDKEIITEKELIQILVDAINTITITDLNELIRIAKIKDFKIMKEKYRKVKAMIKLAGFIVKTGLPAWVVLCLADCVRRGGKSDFLENEIVQLQRRAYEFQEKARRHEGAKARRHEGTKARRHEGSKARRHEGTKAV